MEATGNLVNQKTGEILDDKEWRVWRDPQGKLHRVKLLSAKQLAFITALEYQLGYKPRNHTSMPAYKAVGYINKLKAKLATKTQELKLHKVLQP